MLILDGEGLVELLAVRRGVELTQDAFGDEVDPLGHVLGQQQVLIPGVLGASQVFRAQCPGFVRHLHHRCGDRSKALELFARRLHAPLALLDIGPSSGLDYRYGRSSLEGSRCFW